MAEIVNLKKYRIDALEQRAFNPWQKRFGELYGHKTKLSDLSDRTLYFLARPGETNAVAFYEIIMGILDLGAAAKFYYLENQEKMKIMDIHLFLADQVRFEMMRRLKWLTGSPCMRYSIVEMVLNVDQIKAACMQSRPELAASHPDFATYNKLTVGDKEVFIRRLIPQAIEDFKIQLKL